MHSYWFSMMIALIVMGAGLLLFQLLPGVLLSFFSASARMLQMGIPAFKAISWCFLPAAFGIISGGLFGATGHGFISLFGSLIRQMFGILPLAYIFSRMGSLEMVWWAYPLAEILGTIYFIITVRHLYRTDILGLDDAPAAE